MNTRLQTYRFVVGLTNFVFGIIEVLLILAFIFKLFAASNSAAFVSWLYHATDVLNSPFRGIFQSPVIDGHSILDVTSLVALVIYALLFSLILYVFDFAFGASRA